MSEPVKDPANLCPHCGQAMPNITGITIDRLKSTLSFNGKSVYLQPNQMNLVEFLAEKPGVVRSFQSMFNHLYGLRADGGPSDNMIKVMVSQMRPKLLSVGLAIVNYWGRGYSLQPIKD